MTARNLMIVQGGGPTTVFNASLASAIEEGMRPGGFGRVWGARFGMAGLSKGDAVDMSRLSAKELAVLGASPGAALGSSRFRPRPEDLERALDTLRALDVRHLMYLGGNGTMGGAARFAEFCAGQGYEVNAIGVPKTIDNDLAGTDRCPGYGSAARYVAQSTQELGLDVRSLPQPVAILETMGRSVGWLAAASALACSKNCDAPQLVYVPEVAFVEDDFLNALDRTVAKRGWAVVVVAEGIKKEDGSMVFEFTNPDQQDALKRPLTGGVARHLASVVSSKLKLRCRSEKPGLLGRSSMAHLSEQDRRDAVLVGAAGVKALLDGETGKMVGLTPLDEPDRGWTLVALEEVAGVERKIPAEWLDDGPRAVTGEFLHYAGALVGPLSEYAAEFDAAPALSGVSR